MSNWRPIIKKEMRVIDVWGKKNGGIRCAIYRTSTRTHYGRIVTLYTANDLLKIWVVGEIRCRVPEGCVRFEKIRKIKRVL